MLTSDLAEGQKAAEFIQSTVFLDDETDDMCTILVLGMHRHLQEWFKECVEARGFAKGGKVSRIEPSMLTAEDQKKYDSWTL